MAYVLRHRADHLKETSRSASILWSGPLPKPKDSVSNGRAGVDSGESRFRTIWLPSCKTFNFWLPMAARGRGQLYLLVL